MTEQPKLLEVEQEWKPGAELAPSPPTAEPSARLKTVVRNQTCIEQVCLEDLIATNHEARTIWVLTGKFNLSQFLAKNKSVEGKQGRERWDPRLLVSVLVYSYSKGIGSAREMERQMSYEPGLKWLVGGETINHHTLSDFRVGHGEALNQLMAELLGLLSSEGLVNLEEVVQDGTKVQTVAGNRSLKTEKKLREHVKEAKELVEKLSQETEAEEGQRRTRKEAAQKRAAEERLARMEQAVEELAEVRQSGKGKEKPEQARVSESEPEARVMKGGRGEYAPSYNVQSTMETSNGMIVNVALTQECNDQGQLEPAVERLEQECGQKPGRVIADAGYINTASVAGMEEAKVELIGPVLALDEQRARNEKQSLKVAGIAEQYAQRHFVILEEGKALQCPAGKRLERSQRRNAENCTVYRAEEADCGGCAHKGECCPQSAARTVKIKDLDTPVRRYEKRAQSAEGQEIYKKRGQVEFGFAWIKEKLKLRKFHVRGMVKAGQEMLWAVVTYNIQQWVRLRMRGTSVPAGAN